MEEFYRDQTKAVDDQIARVRALLNEVAAFKESCFQVEVDLKTTVRNPKLVSEALACETLLKEAQAMCSDDPAGPAPSAPSAPSVVVETEPLAQGDATEPPICTTAENDVTPE